MPSYQDIETRLKTVENKLDLVMKVASVTKRVESRIMPGEFIVEKLSLLDLYHELNAAGASIDQLKDENGTD